MIKVGDRVKFLNDVGGGIVTRITGNKTAWIENEDGFEVPCALDQLINVSDPALNKEKNITRKETNEEDNIDAGIKSEGEIIEGKDLPEFYFCFVPTVSQNPVGGEIKLFLVNDSNFTVMYQYGHIRNELYETLLYGTLCANSREELETIGVNDLSELPGYFFQLLYFREEEKSRNYPVFKIFKINPVKFYKEKSYQPNSLFENNALIFSISENPMSAELDKLTGEDFRKVVKSKEPKKIVKSFSKTEEKDIVEVDLHIHELIDDTTGLSNKDILDIQLDKVEREMKSAIESRVKRIVFIHGVGQGVLKQAVSGLLKSGFSKYTFQDASFKEYGYGATMVILRKN